MTASPKQPVRVLIVDDQAPFQRAAEQVLEATDGFEVAGEVATGAAAVAAAQALRPDLVLMDVHLPGIDGPEATRRILAGPPSRRSPVVVLLSTDDEGEGSVWVAGSCAAGYVAKRAFAPQRLRVIWNQATGS